MPTTFCWSKFGTEAGEPAEAILERKEQERRLNGGVFLWGIGNSIRPSLLELLTVAPEPEVLFTPMRSRPAQEDAAPTGIVQWRAGRGIDGREFPLPEHTIVTSGMRTRTRAKAHFALVCRTDEPLTNGPHDTWIDDDNLRNLRTGSRVGSSQVTSVVRRLAGPTDAQRYQVAFHAYLTAPYLVTLEEPVALPRPDIHATAR